MPVGAFRCLSLSTWRRAGRTEEAIIDHRHCPVCKKVVAATDEFCSSRCRQVHLKSKRGSDRLRIIWYVVLVISIAVLFLPNLLRYVGLI